MKLDDSPMLDKNIKKRQQGNLKLLHELVDILEQNNLTYSLAYGTLLGAIRSNKLIDWDADIDLIITKQTYDFLINNYPDKIMTNKNVNHHFLTFPRFVSSLKDINVTNPNSQYIDLFVTVSSNENTFKKYLTKFTNKIKGLCGWTKVKYYFNHKIIKTICRFLVKSTLWWVKSLTFDKVYQTLYVPNTNKYALTVWPTMDNYCLIDKDDLTNLKQIELCGRKFFCLNNAQKYLKQWYGATWKTPIKTAKSIYCGYYEVAKPLKKIK
ncbi:hypothetical protein EG856_00545 [Mycoplasmopsis phocirhinis]|uniref:LicD/FKTN/FKRP nucleotidyltransferase domain-containing protein n=1 Tax=Mycoplasmopsis phocirhinis TaxID=142650 RepID=A0A4P6MLF9_9BACT|nr:LicD family protein [Mycoplasmopsis phocirhinis]QBF34425.1 hypothetical protein EG856_00545 [Mycoplasmopsis phocirhinis]